MDVLVAVAAGGAVAPALTPILCALVAVRATTRVPLTMSCTAAHPLLRRIVRNSAEVRIMAVVDDCVSVMGAASTANAIAILGRK